MTCIYGCKTDGRPCPRPHTCHTLGPKLAAQRDFDEQSKTDKQEACCTGNCRQGRGCTDQAGSSWNLVDFMIIVGAVAIIGLVLAPYAAGYLSHMKGRAIRASYPQPGPVNSVNGPGNAIRRTSLEVGVTRGT